VAAAVAAVVQVAAVAAAVVADKNELILNY
jgi:hypothetical protein